VAALITGRFSRRSEWKTLWRAIVTAQAMKFVPAWKSSALVVTVRNTSCITSSTPAKSGNSESTNARSCG
jgi:hypothetical protein